MTWKRWAFTAVSFAAVIGVSVFFILRWWRAGSAITLPLRAHLLAIAAVAHRNPHAHRGRSRGARRRRTSICRFMTALRTTLAGDFGASITPARSGAEPARFLVLAEAGMPTPSALVVLFAELFLEALSLATVVIVVAIVFRHAGVVLGALVGVVGGYAGFVIGIARVRGRAVAAPRRRRAAAMGAAHRTRRPTLGRDPTVVRAGAHRRSTACKHIDMRWAAASYIDVGDSRRDATVRAAGARARRGRERAARAAGALAARACCTARRWFRRRAAAARWSWRFARRSPA